MHTNSTQSARAVRDDCHFITIFPPRFAKLTTSYRAIDFKERVLHCGLWEAKLVQLKNVVVDVVVAQRVSNAIIDFRVLLHSVRNAQSLSE